MIIIDNGHGYNTPGKRGPLWPNGTQLFEHEFTREVAHLVFARLLKHGLNPYLLVPEKYDVSLEQRVARVNGLYKYNPESFGVSIHANAFTGKPTTANGFEVWTSIGDTESDILAEYLYIEAEGLPFKQRKDERDGDSDKESRFAMVHKTHCPFVLTESGFMDNEKDCAYMLSTEGKKLIAQIHVEAIIKFIIGGRNL